MDRLLLLRPPAEDQPQSAGQDRQVIRIFSRSGTAASHMSSSSSSSGDSARERGWENCMSDWWKLFVRGRPDPPPPSISPSRPSTRYRLFSQEHVRSIRPSYPWFPICAETDMTTTPGLRSTPAPQLATMATELLLQIVQLALAPDLPLFPQGRHYLSDCFLFYAPEGDARAWKRSKWLSELGRMCKAEGSSTQLMHFPSPN